MAENPQARSESADEDSDRSLSIEGLLHYTVQMFAQFAWQKMGFVPDPATGKVDEDLAQARVAIDVLSRLIEHLEPLLGERERREVQSLLSDLRINFARKSAAAPRED